MKKKQKPIVLTPTDSLRREWTLKAILSAVFGDTVTVSRPNATEMLDEGADEIFEVQDGRAAMRLSHYAKYDVTGQKPSSQWAVELWSDPSPPEPADVRTLNHDPVFEGACEKLVLSIAGGRAMGVVLERKRNRPKLSDGLYQFLNNMAQSSSPTLADAVWVALQVQLDPDKRTYASELGRVVKVLPDTTLVRDLL